MLACMLAQGCGGWSVTWAAEPAWICSNLFYSRAGEEKRMGCMLRQESRASMSLGLRVVTVEAMPFSCLLGGFSKPEKHRILIVETLLNVSVTA